MSDNAYAPPNSSVTGQRSGELVAVSEGVLEQLKGTRPWVLLIAVMLFVGTVFMIIAALGIIFAGSATGMPSGFATGMGVAYLLMAFIFYLFPGILLIKYSSAISSAIENASVNGVEMALNSQRKFWKFIGILTIIAIILMVLGIVAAIAIPGFMGMGNQGF